MGYFGLENDASSEFWIHSNDFLRSFHIERGEEAHWIILMVFPKKNICGKWAILGPKIMCGHNSGSDRRIFRRFSTIKQPKRYIKITNGFFEKIIIQNNWAILGQKKDMPSWLWICCLDFLKILHNQRGPEVHEIILMAFPENILQGKWTIFDPKTMHGHNSGFSQRNF